MPKHEKYQDYRDSGVFYLGEVPRSWETKQLKRCVESCVNGVWGGEPTGAEGDMVVIRVADFDRSRLRVADVDFTMRSIPEKDRNRRRLQGGDLLLEKSGGGENQQVGQVVIYDSRADAVTSNFVARLRPLPSVNGDYLNYVFSSLYRDRINTCSIKQNTGIQNLDSNAYLSEKWALPPFAEQQQIAAFLDYETSKIDALIEKQQQLIALLGEKRQAVISQAVTKGLNPNAPMRDSRVEWIGRIPKHWRTPPVYARYNAVLGKMFDENKLTGRHPIVYLRNADVNWDSINVESLPTIDITPHEFDRFTVRKGDLLICEGGAGIGQTAIWQGDLEKCAFQKALHRLRPLDSGVENPRFFYYCMRFVIETGYVLAGGTATIPHLTGEQLRKYRFPCPPKYEQDQIVSHLDSLSKRFDKIEAHATDAVDLLQERRTALISAAVTGKIDVRGWKRPFTDRPRKAEMEVV